MSKESMESKIKDLEHCYKWLGKRVDNLYSGLSKLEFVLKNLGIDDYYIVKLNDFNKFDSKLYSDLEDVKKALKEAGYCIKAAIPDCNEELWIKD